MCDSSIHTRESTALQIRSREQRNDQFVNSTGGDCSIAIRQAEQKTERENQKLSNTMMRVIVSRTILRRRGRVLICCLIFFKNSTN